MLRAILNKSWRQHPRRHQLYGHLSRNLSILSRNLFKLDEPDMLEKQGRTHKWCTLMDPTHGRAKTGRPARTYIQQLCEDTGCCPEDLPEAMNDREKWRERVRDIRATSTTWWWWWWWYKYVYWDALFTHVYWDTRCNYVSWDTLYNYVYWDTLYNNVYRDTLNNHVY